MTSDNSAASKAPIYTRTGDQGSTSLVDGTRVAKNSPRLEAYGTIDELNSLIGAINPADAPHTPISDDDAGLISDIQSALFDIGSYLATDPVANPSMSARMLPDNLPDRIEALEHAIDRIYAEVPRLKAFILPAGVAAASAAHIARTVARRAERRILDLDNVDPQVIAYVNRLSDYLFVLARSANHRAGVAETIWTKH